MSLDELNACNKGYSDHVFDLLLIGVQQGYWAGYFGMSKKPKSLKDILEKLMKEHMKHEDDVQPKHMDTVDVDEYLRRQKAFNDKLNSK